MKSMYSISLIVLLFIASHTVHAMDGLQRELGNLQSSLRQLSTNLDQLAQVEEPSPPVVEPTGPVQQQTMSKSWVKEQLPPGRKDIKQVIPLFQQDMAAHQAENAKIPPKTDDIFRIMSYNVHFWTDPNRQANHDAMWQVVDQVKPDVLILQEASGTAYQRDPQVPDRNSPMVKTFTAKGYKYLATCNTEPGRWFGNIVASKVPSSRMRRAAFAEQERPGEEDRCFSYMALTLPNGKKLHIYGTHLEVGKIKGFDIRKLRDQQVKQISQYIQGNLAKENVLIAGDFNATRYSDAVKNLIDSNFDDSFTALGWQHPVFTSMFGTEIDFMFLNPGWNLPLAGAYIYWSAASDHLPIIMDIKLD